MMWSLLFDTRLYYVGRQMCLYGDDDDDDNNNDDNVFLPFYIKFEIFSCQIP